MCSILFRDGSYTGRTEPHAEYRLVVLSNGTGGERKSIYRQASMASVVSWKNPFGSPIVFRGVATSVRVPIALREKFVGSRWRTHGHDVASYVLALDRNCKSMTFHLSAIEGRPEAPRDLAITVSVEDLPENAAQRDERQDRMSASSKPPTRGATTSETTSGSSPEPTLFVRSHTVTPTASSAPTSSSHTSIVSPNSIGDALGAPRLDREVSLSTLKPASAVVMVTVVGVGVSHLDELIKTLGDTSQYIFLAKGARELLSSAYTLARQHSSLDPKIDSLIRYLDDSCALTRPLLSRPITSASGFILEAILREVLNGADLIKQYCTFRESVKKFANSPAASQIDASLEILGSFRDIRDTFSATVNPDLDSLAATVLSNLRYSKVKFDRSLEAVPSKEDEALLNQIPFAPEADRDLRSNERGCLPGTRTEIIDAILNWATGAEFDSSRAYSQGLNRDSRVLWLCGVAGSGKSSIAITVARALLSMDRLGALYGFEAPFQSSLNSTNLFGTIARQRGERRPPLKRSLLRTLQYMSPEQRATSSAAEQFRAFLSSTDTDDTSAFEDVVVIDAFDESGTASKRAAALLALSPEALGPTFPTTARFIITSRYDPDIAERLDHVLNRDHPAISILRMEDIHAQDTERDIQLYVLHMLQNVPGLEENEQAGELVRLAVVAERSFQWASTACRYILDAGDYDGARLPAERLREVLETRGGLDMLYLSLLDRSFRLAINRESDGSRSLRMILGTLVHAFEPVSVQVIAALASANLAISTVDARSFHLIVRKLSSIISGTNSISSPLVAFHSSFTDFLQDEKRSGPYAVNSSEMHTHLGVASLAVMRQSLCFNICSVETSFVRNDRVPHLTRRVGECISADLSYASRFWVRHLAPALSLLFEQGHIVALEPLHAALAGFLRDKRLILNWLEVISLTGSLVPNLTPILHHLASPDHPGLSYLISDLSDLIRFTTHFTIPLRTSAPHIYLSALAFAPSTSSFASVRDYFPNLVRTATPITSWPSVRHSFGHRFAVQCIAGSPDGQWLAAGLKDGTIHVWDLHLGRNEGHALIAGTTVNSLVFSPNGSWLASGSTDGLICVWDVRNWTVIGSPINGSGGFIGSVAFNPDGSLLASGSGDGTVHIWDTQTRVVAGTLIAHEEFIATVTFSPDGTLLASGSGDQTIRIWDVKTKTIVGPALGGQSGWVNSLAFSPNGAFLAAGSEDGIVRVWDVHARKTMHEVSGNGPALSVAFSPQGTFLAAGFTDNSVRLWSVESWASVGGPLLGHNFPVHAVTFSSNGSLLMSGSADQAVLVWELDSIRNTAASGHEHASAPLQASAVPRTMMSLPRIDSLPPLAPNSLVNLENGWVLGPNKELILWIPPSLRPSQLSVREIAQLGGAPQSQFDFTKFVGGLDWAACYSPPSVMASTM